MNRSDPEQQAPQLPHQHTPSATPMPQQVPLPQTDPTSVWQGQGYPYPIPNPSGPPAYPCPPHFYGHQPGLQAGQQPMPGAMQPQYPPYTHLHSQAPGAGSTPPAAYSQYYQQHPGAATPVPQYGQPIFQSPVAHQQSPQSMPSIHSTSGNLPSVHNASGGPHSTPTSGGSQLQTQFQTSQSQPLGVMPGSVGAPLMHQHPPIMQAMYPPPEMASMMYQHPNYSGYVHYPYQYSPGYYPAQMIQQGQTGPPIQMPGVQPVASAVYPGPGSVPEAQLGAQSQVPSGVQTGNLGLSTISQGTPTQLPETQSAAQPSMTEHSVQTSTEQSMPMHILDSQSTAEAPSAPPLVEPSPVAQSASLNPTEFMETPESENPTTFQRETPSQSSAAAVSMHLNVQSESLDPQPQEWTVLPNTEQDLSGQEFEDFIADLTTRLEALPGKERTEVVFQAFEELGMEQCIEAIVETFGEQCFRSVPHEC